MKNLFVFLLLLSACTPQESQRPSDHAVSMQAPMVPAGATLDIVIIPDVLTDITGWQNVEEHLTNVAPFISSGGRRTNILNEIIIMPTRSAYETALAMPQGSARRQCRRLTREWGLNERYCSNDRLSAYSVAALSEYEHDISRDIMAQELAAKYGLGNGLSRRLGGPTEFSPNESRNLVMRLAAW